MTGIKEFFQSLVADGVIPQEPANYDAATLKMYIAHLEAENAELRARLEKAVELPTIYEHISYPYVERMYSETIYYVIYKENGRIMTEKFGKNKSKAEARLKEIKEKNSD